MAMIRLRGPIVIAVVGVITMFASASASAERLPGSTHGGKPASAELSGSSETPPNITTATGSARITVNPGHDEVCWEITFTGLVTPATAAHIHVGPPGVAGPIVIPTPVPAVTSGTGTGCTVVNEALASAIQRDPGAYYVNVHDSVFPAGQIRGQLH
jgi:hypothetical protein